MLKEFSPNYITDNGYNYFFISKKAIIDKLLNRNEKIPIINLISNMPKEKLNEFEGDRTNITNLNDSVCITEKNVRYVISYIDCDKESKIVNKQLFNWQNFTIDMVYENSSQEFCDYEYSYRNKKFKATDDIINKRIKLIHLNRVKLEEYPEKILQAFAYMSDLEFNIDNQTLNFISKNLDALSKIDLKESSKYIKMILQGKNVKGAIELMKSINVFGILINDQVKFLDIFNSISFDNLSKANFNKGLNWEETVSLLFKDNKANLDDLISLKLIDKGELKKINWIIDEFDMINSSNYKESLYLASLKGIVKDKGLMTMKRLLINLTNIYKKIYPERIEEINKIMFDFCCRPYFKNQIKVTDVMLKEMIGYKDEYIFDKIKDRLIHKLIHIPKFPKDPQLYMNEISDSVEEIINEKIMMDAGLL